MHMPQRFTWLSTAGLDDYVDAHVVEDRRYNFQSFRHLFQECAGGCGLTNYQIDGILGHQPEGMGGRYGKKQRGRRVYERMQLAEGIDRFRIEAVDFSPLYDKY
jgi:hypothetical protein